MLQSFSAKVRNEAETLITAMYKANLLEPLSKDDRFDLHMMVRAAQSYGKIQERWCSEEMTEATTVALEKREKGIEDRISGIAQKFGLTARFEGDPRGFCVKLVAPDQSLYNTWGGRETGYGIGEN